MSAIRLRHVRSVSAFVLLVGCVVFVLPYAQKASAAVLTNGDCSATINEGTGGNANGGIVLTDLGADCLIVFGSARATRTEWIKPVGVTSVRVLVVGAGGYGGYASRGGGGGGGGGEVMHDSAFSVPSASTTVEIFSGRADSTDAVKDASFTVVGGNSLVADGGKNAAISNGGNGSSSTTQAGGGGGNGETSGSPGLGGTSVGGAGGNAAIATNGGGGGGGGGACGAATNAAGANGGNGGAGCSNDITGSAVIYGSGGGGGGGTLGIGGQGGDGAGKGGGDGSTATASERGVASRGGGGGGRNRAGAGTATDGGDGVVIVRYTPVVVDTTPPTLTLATTSSSSNSTSISFTLTGNEAINCATLSSTSGVDFTFTNISSITSIVQTSSNVCTINAESTAVVGTPRTSTLTRSSSFSVADTAGNAQTSVSGSPASVAVTIADSTPPTLTLAVIASTSTSSSIAFTVTGNEAIDCSTLSSSDFTTANIASIDSIVQTNSTTCRINATSTATIGGGMVSSTITASGTFSASDSAGNAQTTLGGGTVSVSVTVPLSDTTAPSASWSAATSSGLSSSFTLTFSEAINGLSSADFSNTGTATGCSFTPSATSGTTITVSVLCAGAGTLVARLGANSVQDAAGNQGPTSAASASLTSLSCAQVSSVSVRNTPRRENGVAAASIGSITRAPSIMQVPRNTTNGGWGWVPGATGTSRTIDGVAWNFNSKRSTSLPSGMRVTVEAVGAGVGIQANPQKMSDRGGANGMYMDNTIVGVSGAQLVTADDGCTYGQICVNRGQFKISFTPAATDPILHFSGLGGGGFDSAKNGRSTTWTEFQVMNPGVTMTVLGQKNLRLVGSNRIELISKNPTSNCSTTSNGYGATASAGCGSVRFSGTFSEIILQADLGSVNNGNPYVGGRLEDAFILAATVSVSQKLVVVTTTSTTTTVPASTTTTTTAPATTTTTTTVAPSTTTTTVLPGCPANNNSNNNNSNNNNSNNNNSNNNNSNNNNSNNNTNSGSGSSSGGIVDAYRVDGAKDLSVVTPGGSAKVNPLNGLITPSNGFNTNSLLILDPKSKRWVSSYSDTSGTYTVVDGKVVVQPALGPDEVTMKQFTFKVTDNDGATSVSAHSVLIASLEDLPEDIGSIVAQESTDSFSFKPGTRINIALPDVFDALPGETLVSSSFGFVEPNGKVVKRLNVPQGTWVYKNDRISFMPINGFIGYVRTPVLIKNSEGVVRNSSISLMVSSSAPTLPNTGSQHQQLLIFSLILIFIGVLLHSQMRKRSKSSRFN